MSYEVTATRRRPQQFDDLVGQEFVAETLKNSIKSGKIAHAYLFSGPRGCGKTSTARILAKALNCQNGPTDNPCGQCSTCQEITKGTSLDVIEIDGASNTSVENIRQIKDEVLFPPSNAKYKIYIIDEVHMLSTSAFNALLKTIEEPPPYVIFIFATTELQKVPATIKSRCQQFNFRLVAIDKVKQCLAEAAAELGIQADDEALFWIARESTGSMRDAYTLFDQVVAFSDGHITYEKIRDKLGLVGIDRLNTVFEACAQNQTETVINLLDEFLQAGVSIEQLISNSADYLRSLLLIKNGVKKESLLGNSPERYSSVVLGAWNTVQIERALSIYLQLYRDIRYSLSPRYELELAFSRLCWIGSYVSSAEVKKAIDAAQALLSGAPVQQNKPAIAQNSVNTVVAVPEPVEGVETTAAPVQPKSEESLGINPIPNGLPRLSMLDKLIEEEANGGGGEPPDADAESANPFHDGGPLPPEQSVAAPQAEISHPAELDERLKLHISQENVSDDGQAMPVMDIPLSASGYSENPDADFGDDGWSNMDAPPDDEYYPDEGELANNAEAAYEEATNPVAASAPVQLQETFVAANGQTISIAQLRGQVTAALAITDGFAASNVEKTGLWVMEADGVSTTVESDYDLSLIEKKKNVIAAEISNICGRPMNLYVTLKVQDKQEAAEKVEIPLQVNILVNAFKGTIVAGRM
ncbi:DNA polymerase-3 subunit gamma/tau [Treponema bryantii]|uniref:DNA polymerase III subunit gamma/tau n=1 Tax=Treponema bryantii TaxID=163 RepID=A0A1I3IAE8_9SPIR|nr:DNA polymerase III subunit gamma/tau [Treponema bryantii]SFI44985.1 DNA polymerase-3 subunit gamma/tau [Treponema bryantii]